MALKSHELQKKAYSDKWILLSDEDIKQVHVHLLEMLVDIDRVCRKYDLYYSLSGGTALGAVRHKGFIPWDDDVDVFFTRESYIRFLEVFDAEMGKKYWIHSPERTPQFGSTAIQIVKKDTVFRTITTALSEEAGVFVDIFILENAPDHAIVRKMHGYFCMFLGLCLSCSRYYHFREKMLEIYKDTDPQIISNIITKSRIGKMLSFFSIEKWLKITYKMYSRCKNNKSKFVVCPSGIRYYFHEIFERDEYCTICDIDFEGEKLKIISQYDKALTRLYGDYMKIPPLEKREKHTVLEMKI